MSNGFVLDDSRGFADYDPNTQSADSALYLDENGVETTYEKAAIARYFNDDGSVNDIDLIVLRQSLSEAINKLKNA
jgi:hypothetical protein